MAGQIPEFSGGESSRALVPLQRAEASTSSAIEEVMPSFDDFGGLDHEIEQLRQVGAVFANPELARQWDVHIPTGVLLCGPGGVGKSELVRAFSREIGAQLIEVAVSDIQSKWVGESNANLKKTFEEASKVEGNTVLFFDELDGLFSRDAGGNSGVSTALISEMKTLLSQLRATQPNMIVAASTNSLAGFDEALLRPGRFDVVMQIPKPGDAARTSIFGKYISSRLELYNVGDFTGESSSRGAIDIHSLAAATDGMTGADIKAILHTARAKRLVSHIQRGLPMSPISQEDILQAIRLHRQQRLNAAD